MTLPDQAVRARAATATDCNLVVNAGAGTGKTTLLVDRFLHILFRPDQPCTLSHIVALTFTNKAAREMKIRLRSRLVAMRDMGKVGAMVTSGSQHEEAFIRNLQALYGLSHATVVDIADRTIQEFERAQIITIHGFAGHLLRLFPIEAQVDPSFQEDEGARLRQYFEKEWAMWLDQELGSGGQHHHLWRPILTQTKLRDVEALAWAFMDELVPIPSSPWPAMPNGLPPALRQWFCDLAKEARDLRQASPKSGIIEQMLEVAVTSFEELVQSSDATVGLYPIGREKLDREVPPKTTTWAQDAYERAKTILQIARAIHGPETAILGSFVSRLLPFIVDCRQRFVESGWVSFSGLIARARNLLRDYPLVRREVKAQIGALLVDEFQDTDPVQYELILLLAEARGQEAQDWESVQLEPGKLFIVGDPKQSIYAFRRADIEAYDVVIQDYVLGGRSASEEHSLQCNFRSHAELLMPINTCFSRLFPQQPKKGVQPRYEALLTSETDRPRLPHECMEARIVVPTDAEADADQATRDEAEALARWLKEEVIHSQEIRVNGVPVRIKPRHVAVLLRTLTSMRVYLEAFRRYDLPYLTEGEKHFFERQEIRDCLSILRVLAYPHDRLALVGVLRSPVGGCSDIQIAQVFHNECWKFWEEDTEADSTPPVYTILRELQPLVLGVPLANIMDILFHKLPLLELAAATVDEEQAVANLLKLRDMVQELATEPNLTYRGLVDQLYEWIHEEKPEPEASLSEEFADDQGEEGAIRVLSIHKAKGLEFPMVIVAGLHRGTDGQSDRVWVKHDWLTDLVGFRMGHMRSLSGIFVETKLGERIRAEQIRLLYVALTRAQRRLVVSAGLPSSKTWQRGSLLALLAEGLDLDMEKDVWPGPGQNDRPVAVGEGNIHLSVIRGKPQKDRHAGWKTLTWHQGNESIPEHQTLWTRQIQALADHARQPLFMSPTTMFQEEARRPITHGPERREIMKEGDAINSSAPGGNGPWVGIVAHRILQNWDFNTDPTLLPDLVDACFNQVCMSENLELLQEWLDDLQSLFAKFVNSEPYTRLCEADILGREVPFAISWPREGAGHQSPQSGVMQGVMDVVYRWHDELWVADYKTDQVRGNGLKLRAEQYTKQVDIYRQALARSMGMNPTSVKAQLIFLRAAQAIDLNWS